MTTAEVERLAREAGMERDGENWFTPSADPLDTIDVSNAALTRFAELVQSAERERCAKVCEDKAPSAPSYFEIAERLRECAAAIRAD